MQIEIWSDVICPWCYIGKRRFEQALAQFGHREQINVIWRSFELDPNAPKQYSGTPNELLSRKYNVSLQQADEMIARVTAHAREVGLEYHLNNARRGNTFDAHRLIHFAAEKHVGDKAIESIHACIFFRIFAGGRPCRAGEACAKVRHLRKRGTGDA